jgi:UDP-N-acetylmuramate dehydrogenase
MTMAGATPSPTLIDRLPPVRGNYQARTPLAGLTWFRVGGPAEVLYRPADVDDLAAFLAGKPADVAVTMLGLGSNLLIRDGGVRGVVIRLGRAFANIAINGADITAGGMALDYNVAKAARDAAIAGFEFMAGVPGTIGGGLRMNAGAYGREFRDVVVSVDVLLPGGKRRTLDPAAWAPRYRGCGVPEDWIFVGATMRGVPGNREEITRAIELVQAARDETQPIRTRTGGSTFKNPDGRKAWELIDAAGCRGLMRGGAQVSNKHCNFLINTGNATADDIEGLGEEVRDRVRERAGIELHWELRRIGEPLPRIGGPRHD